ncbi:hypothetical protein BCR34DRAFT_586392 [Clohesyomyces aquaticus]|uniref:Uncharacterized protein n=1 Tax=Clohesyomyces aquaticus TaxID=1231657 RepID=A0A1Y1ZTM4_9PLEO|nr:hypothetical protein BCR34DRAFT_586392 [Clohesyomyces aquaticus]
MHRVASWIQLPSPISAVFTFSTSASSGSSNINLLAPLQMISFLAAPHQMHTHLNPSSSSGSVPRHQSSQRPPSSHRSPLGHRLRIVIRDLIDIRHRVYFHNTNLAPIPANSFEILHSHIHNSLSDTPIPILPCFKILAQPPHIPLHAIPLQFQQAHSVPAVVPRFGIPRNILHIPDERFSVPSPLCHALRPSKFQRNICRFSELKGVFSKVSRARVQALGLEWERELTMAPGIPPHGITVTLNSSLPHIIARKSSALARRGIAEIAGEEGKVIATFPWYDGVVMLCTCWAVAFAVSVSGVDPGLGTKARV